MSLHRTAAGLVVEVERAGSAERVAVSLDGTDPEAILGEPAHAAGGEIAVGRQVSVMTPAPSVQNPGSTR